MRANSGIRQNSAERRHTNPRAGLKDATRKPNHRDRRAPLPSKRNKATATFERTDEKATAKSSNRAHATVLASPLPLLSSTAPWSLGALFGAASSSKIAEGPETQPHSINEMRAASDSPPDTENIPLSEVERYKRRLARASRALDPDQQTKFLSFLPDLNVRNRMFGNTGVLVVELDGVQFPAHEFLSDARIGVLPSLIVGPPSEQVKSPSKGFITFPQDKAGHTLVETKILEVPSSLQLPALSFARKAMFLHNVYPMRDLWVSGIFGKLIASYQEPFYERSKLLLDVTGFETPTPKVHGMAAFSIARGRLDLQDMETLGNWPTKIKRERGSGQRLLNYLLARALLEKKDFAAHSTRGAIGFYKKRGINLSPERNIYLRPNELSELFNGFRLRVGTRPSAHSTNIGNFSDVLGVQLGGGMVRPASHILTLNRHQAAGDAIIVRLAGPTGNTYRGMTWNEFTQLHNIKKFSVLPPTKK